MVCSAGQANGPAVTVETCTGLLSKIKSCCDLSTFVE